MIYEGATMSRPVFDQPDAPDCYSSDDRDRDEPEIECDPLTEAEARELDAIQTRWHPIFRRIEARWRGRVGEEAWLERFESLAKCIAVRKVERAKTKVEAKREAA